MSFQNDNTFLEAFKSGHKKAFSKVYEDYYASLCRYAFSLTRDLSQAEDIVQDTFINIWKNHENLELKDSFKSYLYRSVYNLFIDRYRTHKRRMAMLEDLRLSVAIEVESERYIYDEKHINTLKQLIETLPEKRKEIFLLNKIQGYKYKEIAEQLNISERTVESQLRKALISIRQKASKITFNISILFSVIIGLVK
ncbi:RNA polymerase sigma-70 factor [uncultured Algibacter sp.]|uniref:RNA polymerase sigma factor n=1 Tax=uncultured Algibacter sp. TaxID=298659 RepID=UPI003217C0F7